MPRIPYAVATPERAAFDIRIAESALAKNPDGSLKAPTFLQIQRDTYHAEELPKTPKDIAYFLLLQRFPNMASIARFVRARRDPAVVPGHNYVLTPGYCDLVKRIDTDPELRELEDRKLFDHLIRGYQPNENVLRLLETPDLSTLTTPSKNKKDTHEPKNKRRTTRTPKTKPMHTTTSQLPNPDYIPVSSLPRRSGPLPPSYFNPSKAKALVEPFAWSTDPKKYQLSDEELMIAKSLAELSVARSDYEGQPKDRAVYTKSNRDVREVLEQSMSKKDADDLLFRAQYKVPKLYGIALAVEEVRGRIPEEAANTRDLIEFTRNHSIEINNNTIYPLKNLTAAGLREVLTRGLTAEELVDNNLLRPKPDFTTNLGGTLEALRLSGLSLI